MIELMQIEKDIKLNGDEEIVTQIVEATPVIKEAIKENPPVHITIEEVKKKYGK